MVFDAEPHNVLVSPHQDNEVLVLVHARAYLVAGNYQAQRYLVWVGSFKGRESCGVEERGSCKMKDV